MRLLTEHLNHKTCKYDTKTKMPESRPEDALGTLVKLQNCAKCTKYLTLLHCELFDLTDGTD